LTASIDSFKTEEDFWKEFIGGKDPYNCEKPENFNFNSLQKLNLIKIFRKDLLVQSMKSFLSEELGP
jgi:hypothetical protein